MSRSPTTPAQVLLVPSLSFVGLHLHACTCLAIASVSSHLRAPSLPLSCVQPEHDKPETMHICIV